MLRLALVLLALLALAPSSSAQDEYGEDRYRPSPLLKRMVREGKRFYP